ncbi:MAG TPA: zinc-ribbon domain-containing protein, partial [Thermoanaerobaculia bacterium]|nr:zinc-ribbon domain-containing protein [Thermoanaerobaculia bacterium]
MIVACPACAAKYRYDEARFDGKPSKKIRCTKCENAFDIVNPAGGIGPSRAAADVRPAAPGPPPPPGG